MKTSLSERRARPRREVAALVGALCIGLASERATAQVAGPAAPQKSEVGGAEGVRAEAREAFRKGTELAKNARWDEALANFQRSYALHAHPVTSYNIAFCERAIGHYTRAYLAFTRALREHESGEAGVLPPNLVTSARKDVREITDRAARVRIQLKPPHARLLVDGQPLEAASAEDGTNILLAGTREAGPAEEMPADGMEVWLDPGSHVFIVSHEDANDTVVTHRYAPGVREKLELTAKPKAVVTLSATTAKAEQSKPLNPSWKFIAFGVGAAGLVAGSVAGAAALRKHSELVDECGPDRNRCPPESQGGIDSMKTFADAATVGFIVGAVGVSVGSLLWIFGGSREGHVPARTGYEFSIGPGSARVTGAF